MKCYNITITGKVQDIGFRSAIFYAGRILDLSGFVFNAQDGSVRILCRGENSIINEFANKIWAGGESRGAIIENIDKKEIPLDIDLPYPFSKVADDEADIGRKLDIGIETLKDIKANTSAISGIKADTTAIKTGIEVLNQKFGAFIETQREFNIAQGEHNKRLEKILEKLSGARP